MTLPGLAYPIFHHPGCAGAAYQAVRGADRPVCAFTAAFASLGNDHAAPLRGEATGLNRLDTIALFEAACAEAQLDPDRLCRWADAINGEKLGRDDAAELEVEHIQGIEGDEYQFNVVADCTVAGHIDASAMGIGKTFAAAFAAVRLARRAENFSRCWIIGTLTAHSAWTSVKPRHAMPWVDYLKRYFDEVKVISIDSAHKFVAAANTGGVVIFDEAHLAGLVSRRMKACHKIRQNFDSGLCLTGTLLHAGVENTLSIYDLAVPGMSLFSSKWKAGDHFKCLVKKQLGGRSVTSLAKPSAEKEKFKEWLGRACVMLTVTSPEIGRRLWPEQHLHEVRLGEPWPKLVDQVADIAMKIYAETNELPHMQKIAHLLCRDGIDEKIDHLLGEISNEPCVIFCHYRESLDRVADRLETDGIKFVRVDGDVTGAPRMEAQRAFQAGECQIFLGQMHAAGISLDLFRAAYSVALDHSWSASDYAQALGRTARRGQTVETHHIDYVSNRLQARVVARLREAQDFNAEASEYIEGKRALASLKCAPRAAQEPGDSSGVSTGLHFAPSDQVLRAVPEEPLALDAHVKGLERQALGLPFVAEIE